MTKISQDSLNKSRVFDISSGEKKKKKRQYLDAKNIVLD